MGVAAGTFSSGKGIPSRLSLILPSPTLVPAGRAASCFLGPGSCHHPADLLAAPPPQPRVVSQQRESAWHLFSSFWGPPPILGRENLRILHFSETSFPSEESQGLAVLNLDPFFFVLRMCIYIIN